MKALKRWGLSAAIGLGGAAAASAGPISIAPHEVVGTAPSSFERVVLVCGPNRCWRRPGWLYQRRPGLGWGWSRTFDGPEHDFRQPFPGRRFNLPEYEFRLRR